MVKAATAVARNPVANQPCSNRLCVESSGNNADLRAITKSHPSFVGGDARQRSSGDDFEPASKPATSADVDPSDKAQQQSVSDSTVRIDVTLLDKLMNLVGKRSQHAVVLVQPLDG